jgi:parallel beta-helix repeat protein/predicted outer membrane repeat protein
MQKWKTFSVLCVISVLFHVQFSYATDISGDAWGRWTVDESPYYVIGEVRVPPDSTLIIDPGIEIYFYGYHKFMVDSNATLQSVGTEQDSILFTEYLTGNGWHGIRFMNANSQSRLAYCKIEKGYAWGDGDDKYGGAIYCNGSSPTIDNNTITENSTEDQGNGGAIYCVNSDPSITNNIIAENNTGANGRGGAVYCLSSSPSITGNIISGNEAATGGAIYCDDNSDPSIINNTITGNSASYGGIISCGDNSPDISDNSITANTATAISCYSSTVSIRNNTITGTGGSGSGSGIESAYGGPFIVGNTITNYLESGILCYDSSPTIQDNLISDNTNRNVGGGAIHIESDGNYIVPIIHNNIITRNSSWHEGGAIYCVHASPSITGNEITENSASESGGAIYLNSYNPSYDSLITISDNYVAGNSASEGGGIYIANSSNCTIGSNFILNNNATGTDGGGIFLDDFEGGVIRFNVIADNHSAENGGGIYFSYVLETDLINNTISWNSAYLKGGGIYCTNSNIEIINGISWNNIAISDHEISLQSGSNVFVSYSDIKGGWIGEGNIDEDPLFVLAGKRDYRLLWESPCIDTGNPDSLDVDETRSDIGAHYFNQNDYMTLYLTPDTTKVIGGGQLGVTYTVINRWDQVEPFWGLTEVILPNSYPFTLLGPVQFNLPANTTIQHHFNHNIPAGAPLGRYEYRTRIGLPPSTLYDEDRFTFRVFE